MFLKAYSIGLSLLLVVVLWKSNFIQKVGYHLGWVTPLAHHKKMMVYHHWMDSVIPEGSVLFIGDSITQALPVSAVVPNGVNLGIGGDTTIGVLLRISKYKSLEQASVVVLLIGVNDLAWRENTEILASMKEILQAIPDGPSILLCSLLPVRESSKAIGFEQATRRIQAINASLKEMAKKQTRIDFIDLNSHLSDTSGQLDPAFDSGDGLHLSPKGYEQLIKCLIEALS